MSKTLQGSDVYKINHANGQPVTVDDDTAELLRIALDIAKESPGSPFKRNAKFIEIDATTLRFDDRGIADPLMGSVHDPIYQGAGAYGPAGIP